MLCQEALEHHFGAVCINSCWTAFCSQLLQGSGIKVGGVVGFPWGTPVTASKVAETRQALLDGASEIDMVMNYGNSNRKIMSMWLMTSVRWCV